MMACAYQCFCSSFFCTKGLLFSYHKPFQNSDYLFLKLTLRFSVIVVEVFFPLCCGEFTHISNKQIFFVVTAEPV